MGLQFNLAMANWVAWLIDDRAEVPAFPFAQVHEGLTAADALEAFLGQVARRFVSLSTEREIAFREDVEMLLREVRLRGDEEITSRRIDVLRNYFNPRDWTALILPGWHGTEVDRMLSSSELLRNLVDTRATTRGLVMQLEDAPKDVVSLSNVFPPIEVALDASTEWPALLVWSSPREAELFTLGEQPNMIVEAIVWILNRVSRRPGRSRLVELCKEYQRVFKVSQFKSTRIIQISDIHLGSKVTNRRLPALQQHVANLVESYRTRSHVALVVTGDLMDSPSTRHLDQARAFVQFLGTLNTIVPPVIVLGNHDVRRNGFLNEDLRQVLQIVGGVGASVRWLEEVRLGFVVVNSVVDGHLARGWVGERQMIDLGVQLDQRGDRDDFTLIAALHHHPIPVDYPDWYRQRWHEKVLGRFFEHTVILEDSLDFLEFVREQGVSAVIHGHKHIPRWGWSPSRIPIIGCGSSVGKVRTRFGGSTYLSINVVTVNRAKEHIAARLLASRTAGGRLRDDGGGMHQLIVNSPTLPGRKQGGARRA